jgi:hypothetical protein
MDKGSGLLTCKIISRPKAQPRLRLLIEWESPPRIFCRNLVDLLLFRTTPVIKTSRLAPFWKDVFVDSSLPWWGLLESLLWHLLAATAVWIFSQTLVSPKHFQERIASPSHITYYTPPPSFPALGSNPLRIRTRPKARNDLAHQPMIPMPRRSTRAINPPDTKMAGAGRPDRTSIPSAAELPSSERSLQLSAAAALSSVVAPPPAVAQTTSRRLSLPEASAVAPPPNVEAVSARDGAAGPSAAIVAPSPVVQVPMRGVGDINIGHSEVVAPAPVLPMQEQRGISGIAQANLGNPGAAVIPPPPSVQRSGIVADGRGGSSPGAGFQVVPPPPSIQSAANSAGGGRAGSLPGKGWQVVPPPPSVQAAENVSGGGRTGSLSGTGSAVVPPPPSVQAAGNITGNISGGGRGGSLSGSGLQVVPPPPSIQSAGNSTGGGRTGSLSGTGLAVVPPPPSIQSAGNSARGGRVPSSGAGLEDVGPSPLVHQAGDSVTSGHSSAVDAHPAVASPSVMENPLARVTEELSVRLIGLALSLPNSSYFANYEVFIAERRIKNAQSQFIKLVYESLPYQRRLSEYALNSAKVYKLRVRRDLSCDESLLQMTWPESDPHPGSQNSSDSPGLTANDRNNMLPCYRTTADDYRKALSHGR